MLELSHRLQAMAIPSQSKLSIMEVVTNLSPSLKPLLHQKMMSQKPKLLESQLHHAQLLLQPPLPPIRRKDAKLKTERKPPRRQVKKPSMLLKKL